MKYLALVQSGYGGGWSVDELPDVALRQARSHVAVTAKTEDASYVLEFPDDAEITVNSIYGGWTSNVMPIRVERQHKVPAGTHLLGVDLTAKSTDPKGSPA